MEETEHKAKPKRRRGLLILVLTTAVVLILGVFLYWFFMVRDTGPIPRKYTKDLNITLYYPTRLPKGYSVDPDSFERKEGSVIFSIVSANRTIGVSLQATPPNVPVRGASKAPISIPGERDFSTGIGQAHLGLWGKKYVSDIITPKGTWVILNVTGIPPEEAIKLTQSFTEL